MSKNRERNKMRMHWPHIIELSIFLFTILATTITLHLHMDSKVEDHRKETNAILEGIRQDMRDFHGRLCAIEERNRK